MDPYKRTHNVHFRLNEPEYKLLQFKLAKSGQSVQRFMYQAIYDAKVTSTQELLERRRQSELLADIDRQLRGIGTNINQMAHIANGYGYLPTLNELKIIYDDITMTRKDLKDIWQLIKQSINQQNHMGR